MWFTLCVGGMVPPDRKETAVQYATETEIPSWARRDCDPLVVAPGALCDHERTILDQIDNHPDVKAATVLFRDDCSGILTVAVDGYSARERAFGAYQSLCLPDDAIEIHNGRTPVWTICGAHGANDFDALIENRQVAQAEAAAEDWMGL